MEREIFISYSRWNLEKVKVIKKVIEQATDAECWMDLNAIETGATQFTQGIVDGIKSCRVFLFMLSKESQDSKFALRELNFAMKKAEEDKQKHVVIVNIDDCHMTDEFYFMYGLTDTIAWNNQPQNNKLLRDMKAWLGRDIVEKVIHRLPESIESVKKDIKKKAIEYQNLAGQQDDILKELYSKNEYIGNTIKHCPVCEKEEPIQSQFCSQCGWQFPKLYGIDGGDVPLHDEAQLAIARKCWQGFSSIVTSQKENAEFSVNGVSFKMILVEGGPFMMGATSEQGSEASNNEKPMHQVTLSDYYIGETQVTQELWQAVMGSNPSCYKGANRPVENVSWDDCQKFISQLNKLIGKRFRLPTEAEWEFAARGGKKGNGCKYAGSYKIDAVAWYGGNSGNETHPVGQKQPNELGLYDMSGNVWEWCNDKFRPYSFSPQSNPQGPSSGSNRVSRGGSWSNNMSYCRVANRNNIAPLFHSNFLGFRLAL